MAHDRRLSTLEASFLEMEGPGIPMHVAGVSMVGGPPISLSDLRELITRRVRRLPVFHRRVGGGLLGVARASWIGARLDIDEHLFHHRLVAPGRMRDLCALCARIQETPLSRDQPLWEVHLIDGLASGDQALVIKTHHAITDGLAGVEVAQSIFDPPDGSPRPRLHETRFGTKINALGITAAQSLLGLAYQLAGGPLAAPGPFNGPVGPHRAFGATALPMEAIRRVKQRVGGSVDDLIVATVAAGLYRHLVDAGHPAIPRGLRAMLPVSTRHSGRAVQLGNQVSSIFIDLPMRSDDVAELVPEIARAKTTLRMAYASEGGTLLVEAAGLLPAPLHGRLMRLVSSLPFAHLVLSDIPGADVQLRLLGRPVKVSYPMMPLTRNIGLSIAAVSGAESVGIGVTADPSLVPSPQRIATAIGRAFTAAERVGGTRSLRRKAAA